MKIVIEKKSLWIEATGAAIPNELIESELFGHVKKDHLHLHINKKRVNSKLQMKEQFF